MLRTRTTERDSSKKDALFQETVVSLSLPLLEAVTVCDGTSKNLFSLYYLLLCTHYSSNGYRSSSTLYSTQSSFKVMRWRNGQSVGLAINMSLVQFLLGAELHNNLGQVVHKHPRTFVTKQYNLGAVILCDWEGNRRPGEK